MQVRMQVLHTIGGKEAKPQYPQVGVQYVHGYKMSTLYPYPSIPMSFPTWVWWSSHVLGMTITWNWARVGQQMSWGCYGTYDKSVCTALLNWKLEFGGVLDSGFSSCATVRVTLQWGHSWLEVHSDGWAEGDIDSWVHWHSGYPQRSSWAVPTVSDEQYSCLVKCPQADSIL